MNRRSIIIATTAATATTLLAGRPTRAAEPLKPLDTSHPPAKALKYVNDFNNADPSVYEAGSGERCSNCVHYEARNDEQGTCAIFPGFSVAAKGWCAGWVAAPSG